MDALIAISILSLVPLLFLAIAALIPWLSGVLVVSLEGFMLQGAFVGAVVAAQTDSQSAGFAAAAVAGATIGGILGWLMVYLRADQVVTGIAFNIAMIGATSFLFAVFQDRNGAIDLPVSHPFFVPGLSDLPTVGTLLTQHWFAPLSIVLAVAAWYIVNRTGVGLRLRACGDFAVGAHASGVNVGGYRLGATVISGALAGLGGAFLSIVVVQTFTEDMTAGRGYIALTIVILGQWRPVGVALGAVLFAVAEGLSVVWQGNWGLPSQFFQSLPYLFTLVLVAASAKASSAPREEARPLTVGS